MARGGESVFRGSLFRAGYELFYTPIPAAEKRAAKSIIDVAFDRLGDAVGGGLVRAGAAARAGGASRSAILSLAMACSAARDARRQPAESRLHLTLEKSLLNRAVELDLVRRRGRHEPDADAADARLSRGPTSAAVPLAGGDSGADHRDRRTSRPRSIRICRTFSRSARATAIRRRACCAPKKGCSVVLVPHVIPLLAWDPVAADAVFALRKVAEERVGPLIDALIDPNQDFAVRRRLARVFSVCVSQRAADGLMLGLDDLRFEVRFQCGHSLAPMLEKNPRVTIDSDRIFAVVTRGGGCRPAGLGEPPPARRARRPGRRLVRRRVRAGSRRPEPGPRLHAACRWCCRGNRCRSRFAACHTDDQNLQGTALEYLEGVLPPPIRDRLWPFLEIAGRRRRSSRAARRDPGGPAALEPLDHAEPRGTAAPGRRRAAANERRLGRRTNRMRPEAMARPEQADRAAGADAGARRRAQIHRPAARRLLDEQVAAVRRLHRASPAVCGRSDLRGARVRTSRRARHRRPETASLGIEAFAAIDSRSLVLRSTSATRRTRCQTKTRRRPRLHGPQRDR